MTKDEALRLALEALEKIAYVTAMDYEYQRWARDAITAIKAALEAKDEIDWKDMYEKEKRRSEMWVAKYERDIGPLEKAVPQQEAKDEPVAWQYRDANDDGTWSAWTGCDKRLTESDWRKVRPLYTTPPQRPSRSDITWVGLTHAEIDYQAKKDDHGVYFALGALWAEAKLKAKNT